MVLRCMVNTTKNTLVTRGGTGDDVRDWQKNLSQEEKIIDPNFQIFYQADAEVNNCYLRHYQPFLSQLRS